MPTSRPKAQRHLKRRAGFTLLEILLALAVMGVVMAIVLPNIPRTLSSNADQRTAFHFQRLVLDLKAEAFRGEQDILVVDSGQYQEVEDADPRPAEIKLEEGWTYRLAQPLTISARGLCTPVDADLFYRDRPRLRMHAAADCNFTWDRLLG